MCYRELCVFVADWQAEQKKKCIKDDIKICFTQKNHSFILCYSLKPQNIPTLLLYLYLLGFFHVERHRWREDENTLLFQSVLTVFGVQKQPDWELANQTQRLKDAESVAIQETETK
jgi:hypothetical protein